MTLKVKNDDDDDDDDETNLFQLECMSAQIKNWMSSIEIYQNY